MRFKMRGSSASCANVTHLLPQGLWPVQMRGRREFERMRDVERAGPNAFSLVLHIMLVKSVWSLSATSILLAKQGTYIATRGLSITM